LEVKSCSKWSSFWGAGHISPLTIETRKRRFEKYAKAVFGAMPLSKIDPLEVKKFYRSLEKQGVGPPTIVEIRGDLVRVFNQAISPYQRVSMTVANPFRITVPRTKQREAVALNPEEVLKALRSKDLDLSQQSFLATLLLAGIRLGEIMALTRGQLDFENGTIRIDRAVRLSYGGKQSVGLPKKDRVRRVIMCDLLKEILEPFVAELEPDRYLWSAETENKPRMKKVVYNDWQSIITATSLPAEMSPHDCRLTHINLIEKLMLEVSETTLKEHVGHSGSGVTQTNYTRPITASQQILRDALNRVFPTL
jgi:integrase